MSAKKARGGRVGGGGGGPRRHVETREGSRDDSWLQTVVVQCVNEVVARCSLFTGILFVHPGLKHSYEIRTATLAWEMLVEQLGSVRVDGHAAVFGCLSQAVSEFPVQIERHVHLSTSLQGRPGGPLLVHAGGTPIKTTTIENSPGSDPSAGKDRYLLYRAQRMQSTRCERDMDHPLAVQRSRLDSSA